MSKFYVGQKVLVTGCAPREPKLVNEMVGKVCEIKSVGGGSVLVYQEDKSDAWFFNPSYLQPINETPETLTVNGVEYIRKPEPVVEHEWKFGDVAVHEEYGVGIVTRETNSHGVVFFDYNDKDGGDGHFVQSSSLTFIRRADLSV